MHTKLISTYQKIDSRFVPLWCAVRHLAEAHYILSCRLGYLSSFALVLMLITYLQSVPNPPILPKLQQQESSHMFCDFGVQPSSGPSSNPKRLRGPGSKTTGAAVSSLDCVLDPFERDRNVTANINTARLIQIQSAFQIAGDALDRGDLTAAFPPPDPQKEHMWSDHEEERIRQQKYEQFERTLKEQEQLRMQKELGEAAEIETSKEAAETEESKEAPKAAASEEAPTVEDSLHQEKRQALARKKLEEETEKEDERVRQEPEHERIRQEQEQEQERVQKAQEAKRISRERINVGETPPPPPSSRPLSPAPQHQQQKEKQDKDDKTLILRKKEEDHAKMEKQQENLHNQEAANQQQQLDRQVTDKERAEAAKETDHKISKYMRRIQLLNRVTELQQKEMEIRKQILSKALQLYFKDSDILLELHGLRTDGIDFKILDPNNSFRFESGLIEVFQGLGFSRTIVLAIPSPSIRFYEEQNGVKYQLSLYQPLEEMALALIKTYSQIDHHRFLPLWFSIRQIASRHGLLDTDVLPVLQRQSYDRVVEGSVDDWDCSFDHDWESYKTFASSNTESPASLLKGFCHYFGNMYNYADWEVNVGDGKIRVRDVDFAENKNERQKLKDAAISVMDPFALDCNVASHCHQALVDKIQKSFRVAGDALQKGDLDAAFLR
ncbi:hypothetical protein BGZ83_004065 [Gryganskiella cystojenkinii]|nr:hypothetical protein BGZ83_004065 [Gryganskiella cystojenkinii]